MRLMFAGTPDIAALCLDQLCLHHEVTGVLTQPDRPCGRGKKLEPSAVKQSALRHNIPVKTPEKIDADTLAWISELSPDLMIVVAYGLILPTSMLMLPPLGCWNIHYSLLPRWRGAAPVQRAVEAGDTETGVAIMQMAKGLDTGDILWEQKEPIHPHDTSHTLSDRLATLGAQALLEAITLQQQGKIIPRPQEQASKTYAHKLSKT
jgi:methionyl-tRNA formyltransferase